ncbi:head-tail connector protein [Pseudaquidulcibacter saccharophilus]|uniref:head-tail connector protein n=1 Tax=Pseudaquidulcibacter saccharophilus TaxID=2831900 RepID=UPI001EFF3351|nr:phage head-tail connector protein [Pseudaquidulcibacter saccharophilus]
MTNIVLVQPSELPLTLDEVKTYLRIGTDGDDNMLLLLLKAAVEMVEAKNAIALISRKLRQSISAKEIHNAYKLAQSGGQKPALRPDFHNVTAIDTVRNSINGIMVTAIDLISLQDNLFYLNRYSEGLEIDYFAGFANAASVPNSYKLEILEEIGRAIQNRDDGGQNQNPNIGVRL